MVWSLDEIQHVEDLQLLSGHVHMILGDVTKAQVSLPNQRCTLLHPTRLMPLFVTLYTLLL